MQALPLRTRLFQILLSVAEVIRSDCQLSGVIDEPNDHSEGFGYRVVNAGVMLLGTLISVISSPGQSATPSNARKAQNKCADIQDASDWLNPLISVNAKSVVVTINGSSEQQREIQLNQLEPYLKQLPKSAWKCGKVVAAAENGLRGIGDGPAIRRNCSAVAKILAGLGLKVSWWPSA